MRPAMKRAVGQPGGLFGGHRPVPLPGIPGVEVSTKLFLLCEGCRYDITSVEDVKGRGMYVEILAKKVVAANG